MAKTPKKAQTGINLPPVQPVAQPQLQNQASLQEMFGQYQSPGMPSPLPSIATLPPVGGSVAGAESNNFAEFVRNAATSDNRQGGGRIYTEDELEGAGRYDYFQPSSMGINNEDVAAQYQGWGEKMVNGVLKGGSLALTTFLQGTVGAVNGLYQWNKTGKFSSFYDNEFNRALDQMNKDLEDQLPNYYSNEELNAKWYSPKYWMTGNFLWDGVVKNLGFAAGAYASGAAYASALRALPLTSRLFTTGKAAETLAATEKGLSAANRGAGVYGEVKALSDNFLSSYNILNPAGRITVAGLATSGEAGIEALHNSNEYRDKLIKDFELEYGVMPSGDALAKINEAVEGAGNSSYFMNVAILGASNYVMFPMIARSGFGADKAVLNDVVKETQSMVYKGGKLVPNVSKLHPLIQGINKIRPYTFSVTEAAEEVGQYGAGVASQDYYNKQYNNEPTSWIESIGVGLTDGVFSDQGAKNALIGGISGRIMTIRGMLRRDKEKSINTQNAYQEINATELSDFTKESAYAVNRAGVLIEEMQRAAQNGDEFTYKNLESDFIINYLTPRIKYGRYDLVKQDISDLKKLAQTEEGFAQLQAEGKVQQGTTREQYIARLDNLQNVADNVKSLYQSLNLRYGGIVYEGREDADGKPVPVYNNTVMDKMIYAASSVASLDVRIPQLSQELQARLPNVNIQDVLQDILNRNAESFNQAVDEINNLDVLQEVKDELGQGLQDLAAMAVLREKYLQEYQEIKENPDRFRDAPISQERTDETVADDVNTFVVKTKNGEQNLQIGADYFVGEGVDFTKDTALDEPISISTFRVLGQNEDGTIKIRDGNGQERDISPDVLLDYKVGRKDSLLNNKTANFYFENRNKVYQFNFGKNFGGKRKGRLAYDNGKLFFVYKDANGKLLRKQLANKFFIPQEGYDQARITPVGTLTSDQKKAQDQFLTPEELAKNEQTLAQNRENRLKIMNDLGVESKRRLEEINKQLERDRKKLADIRKDLEAINAMKDGGPRIKLKYSKAQQNFTRAINKLTEMEADTNKRINELELEAEELEFNISYFSDFGKDLLELPGNTSEFLQELKDQLSLLEQNGKQVKKEIAANEKLLSSIKKAVKKAAKLLKSALEGTYVYDQDYGDYMRELLDKAAKGEDVLNVWPLLKEELSNFNLTNDIQKDSSISERGVFEAIQDVKELEQSLNDLRAEYKAKKAIVDRFQRIMDEYNNEKRAQEKIAKDPKIMAQIMSTQNTGPVIEAEPKSFNPNAKKSLEVLPRATVAPQDGKDHQVRANTFGAKLNTFENRDNIRAVYVTQKTQNQLLDGVVERVLDDGNQELMDKYADTAIVMVMIDTAGNLVGVDGKPIPSGENQLDNAIYQVMPLPGFRDGEMFRENTPQEVKDQINEKYKKFTEAQLEKELIPAPFKVEASFGIPQYEKDGNDNDVLGTNSVVDADLISEEDLTKRNVILIPTTNKNVFRGTVSYAQPLGSVFLDLPNGLVKLRNRKHTEKEATAIYQAIYELSKQIVDPDQGATSDTSIRMLNFLKGVTYWGIPRDQQGNVKDVGQNSVFFRKELMSTFGEVPFNQLLLTVGTENKFVFNPKSLEKNKSLIIEALGNLYVNINNAYTQDISRPFEQITNVTEDGSVESIRWPNYQSFLLSKNIPEGGTREDFELPLHTTMKKVVEGSDQVNREGIYFVNEDTADDFIIEGPSKKRIEVIRPSGNVEEAAAIVLDNKKTNTYTSPQGKKILFKAPADTTIENYQEKITIMQGGDLAEVLKVIEDAGKDRSVIKSTIYNYIAPKLAQQNSEEASMSAQMSADQFEQIKQARERAGKKPVSQSVQDALRKGLDTQNPELLREVTTESVERMDESNWKEVSSWMGQNLPGVQVNRVKNIIRSGGRTAWGMFQNNAIFVYENAEVGTAYHEAFEAVYSMFLDSNEIVKLNEEFKARTGTFVDRPTGRTVKYKDATPDQIREQLAEEFRDYIQEQKKPQGNFFSRMFKQLKDLITNWFMSPQSNTYTKELFDRINTGYFSEMGGPSVTQGITDIDFARPGANAVFRVTGLNDKHTHDIIEQMTYLTLKDVISNNESLFRLESDINKAELYSKLKEEVLVGVGRIVNEYEKLKENDALDINEINDGINSYTDLMVAIDENWDNLTKRHQEYLQAYNITFDENDSIELYKEDVENDKSNKGFNLDATKIDNFKKTNQAVKLLLATVPQVVENSDGTIKADISSINGVKLIPLTKVYTTLLTQLHDTNSISDMLNRLREIATGDPSYRTLYKRITNQGYDQGEVTLDNITEQHQLDLISALWKTFKKQSPMVKEITILENGEVAISNASIASASRQIANQFLNNVITTSKNGTGMFKQVGNQFQPDTKKLATYPLNTTGNMVKFLRDMGISFNSGEFSALSYENKKRFQKALNGLKSSISKTKNVKFFSRKSLDISGRLMQIAELKVIASHPEVSTTYFDVNGERNQTHIGVNAASEVYDTLNKVETLDELGSTPYSYLLTDKFSQGSSILNRMFDETGNKRVLEESLFYPGYAGGIVNLEKGTRKKSGNLQFPDRLRQELSLNLEGTYMNLVPGDSSLEHTLQMGNPIDEADFTSGGVVFNQIMKDYFISEVEVARQERRIVETGNRQTTDLRFFKPILGEELHEEIRQSVLDNALTAEEVYDAYAIKIVNATTEYLRKQTGSFVTFLEKYGVLEQAVDQNTGELLDGYVAKGVQGLDNLSPQQVIRKMAVHQQNYIIANIEMHKILYGDPYLYKDELKRTKSFLSPRQALISNSPQWNQKANELWNRDLNERSIGYTDFNRDYFRTVTHGDVVGVIDLPNYESFEETDGGGIISFKAYRNFRLRASDWNAQEEKQFEYDVAYEKRAKNLSLTQREKDLLKEGNPQVASAYTTLKPIVSGSKLAENGQRAINNDVVLDKYALYPLSYRIINEINPGANALKLYNKMQNENIDYIIFESGRKVGADVVHNTYNEDGSFNDAEYEGVVNVPFNIMSLQSEVPSKEDGKVTRGSQITKLVTLDFLSDGVPIDYNQGLDSWMKLSEEQKKKASPIYAEIENNTELLNEMTKEATQVVMNRLGIEQTENGFIVTDMSPASKTLRDEIFNRQVNDNISSALDGFLMGDAILEATPAYNQIRNILYSIVQKNIVRPKISGGQKVQIPSALFESSRVEKTTINGKTGYTSDVLNFYTNKDGERVMEVMVGRWFGSSMSDSELLDYLNNTEEGQSILKGVAFRIPTQAQNSIDAIKIKQFLPKEFGDNVVVPAAIVEKVGSDFDIDKLFIYLKNVTYINDELKAVPFYGYGQQAKDRFAELYDTGALLTKKQKSDLNRLLADFTAGERTIEKDAQLTTLLDKLGVLTEQDVIEEFMIDLQDQGIKDAVVNKMYMKSLENEYIQSTENLVSSPENFDKLITPNSAEQLKALSKEIVEKIYGGAFEYDNVGNLLSQNFMTRLRNAFVAGKKGIGIAAVNQTNLALMQHSPMFVEKDRIKFRRKNVMNIPDVGEVISLSGSRNQAGQLISNINGQFIDGYVDISGGPWIIEMGATPSTVSTWLYLIKAGVPVDSVAYFINQPIVVDYLNRIENSGYSWLFIEDFSKELKENKYSSDSTLNEQEREQLPTVDYMRLMVGKTNFSNKEKAFQRFILDEFLNYASQARDMFELTQGTNWDTSTFNDPYLIFKKQEQYINALSKPIFGMVDTKVVPAAEALVRNTFLDETIKSLVDARNGLSELLTSDQSTSRLILQDVLRPYINTSDRQFVKTARKAVNSFFDYAVQTDQQLNSLLKSYLIDKNGVASEVLDFVEEVLNDVNHPLYNNEVINLLESNPSRRSGLSPNNLQLRNNDRKIYEQNTVIYAFRELKDQVNPELYKKIVTFAVLQSGLNNSPISFTSLLPYEDFQEIYNATLSTLDSNSNLSIFRDLGMFERNNWNDDTIVPYQRAPWVDTARGKVYNPGMYYLPKAVKDLVRAEVIPQVLTLSVNSRAAQGDYVIFTWNNPQFDKQTRKEMASRGDFSFINKGLFKKVYGRNSDNTPNSPFIHGYTKKDGTEVEYFVFKHINALGDSIRAQEYYTGARPSVIENGTLKAVEKSDLTVIKAFVEPGKISNTSSSRPKPAKTNKGVLVTLKGDEVTLSKGERVYSRSEINAVMLQELGYDEEVSGKILKTVCK